MGTRQKGHQGWGEEEQRGGEQTFLARRTRLSCLVSLQHLAAFLSSKIITGHKGRGTVLTGSIGIFSHVHCLSVLLP